MAAFDVAPRLYLDALLTPHRSLSRRGLYILLAVLAAYNVLIAIFLLAIGAFPVPIFLGVDFLAVVIAFRASNRSARAAERVQVSAEEVRVLHQGRHGSRTVWRSPTAFTRVLIERRGEHEARIWLRLHGRSCSVGAELGPEARDGFATELEAAIRSARAERYG